MISTQNELAASSAALAKAGPKRLGLITYTKGRHKSVRHGVALGVAMSI